MKELNFDDNRIGVVTDLRFCELELNNWINGSVRAAQLKADKYYRGQQDVYKKTRTLIDSKGKEYILKNLPNNKVVNNQYAKMVDQITNFEMGQPITFDTDLSTTTGKNLAKQLSLIFGKQTLRTLKKTTRHAVNEGISWLFIWPDIKNKTLGFSLFPAYEILPEWADDEHKELDCAMRYYVTNDYNDLGVKQETKHVEVFDGNGIHRFLYVDGSLKPDGDTPTVPYLQVKVGETFKGYNWTRCPLIPFRRSDLENTLLSKCKDLVDALNFMLSVLLDALQENAQGTRLVIKNYDGTDWDAFIHNLVATNIIPVHSTPEGDGGVETLEINVTIDNYKFVLDALKKAIIENCGGFDAKDDRLGSNPNQMNIASMYSDIEITANDLESEFAASFEQVMWFVKQWIAQTGGVKENKEDEKAEVIFNRDMMINESEVIQNCSNSVGLISNETILKNHSWVDDPQEEMKRLQKQQEADAQQTDTYRAAFEQTPQKGVNKDGDEEE